MGKTFGTKALNITSVAIDLSEEKGKAFDSMRVNLESIPKEMDESDRHHEKHSEPKI
jgi:hypothetical protein